MITKCNLISSILATSLVAITHSSYADQIFDRDLERPSYSSQDFDFTGKTQVPQKTLDFTSSDDFIHVTISASQTKGNTPSTSYVKRAIYGIGIDAQGADTSDMDNVGNTSSYQEGWDRMQLVFDEPVKLNSISFSTWEAGSLVVDDDAADIYALINETWVFLGRAETLDATDITTTISTSAVSSTYYTHHLDTNIKATTFAIQVPEVTTGERPIEFRIAGLNVTGSFDHECDYTDKPKNTDKARILFTDATPYPAPWMNFWSERSKVEVNAKAFFTRDLDYVAIPTVVTQLIHGLGSQAFGESSDMDNIGNTLIHTEGWDRLEFTFDQPVHINNISFSNWEPNNLIMRDDAADIYALVDGTWELMERAEATSYRDLSWYIDGSSILSLYYTHEFVNSPVATRFAIQVPELRTGQRPIEFRVSAIEVTPASFIPHYCEY